MSSEEFAFSANRGVPSADVEVDAVLASALLAEQHPDLAGLPVRMVESGWDNVMLRLGDELALRMPRRALGATLIEHEQRWLPELAPHLPLSVPVPVRVGAPGSGYPWSWSVLRWMPGVAADIAPLRADQGAVLGAFLRALHRPAPPEAPPHFSRGVPLLQRRDGIEERLERLERLTDCITPAVRRAWEQALSAPINVAPTWLHGDLHSRNALVDDGVLSAIIDWGDITQGDCATDLAAIWNLLPQAEARAEAIEAYGPASEATWQRARGWAVVFGVLLLDSGLVNDARLASAGEATLRRLNASP